MLFSTTPVKLKHVFIVRTAYDHKRLGLSSLQVTSLMTSAVSIDAMRCEKAKERRKAIFR